MKNYINLVEIDKHIPYGINDPDLKELEKLLKINTK